MNKYIESLTPWGIPESILQQAFDMATQAMGKALEAAQTTIELHNDDEVRLVATTLFIEMMNKDTQDKMPLAALSLSLVGARHRV